MATLEEKLTKIVEEDLQGTAQLETLPNRHVSGSVISPLFDGKDYHDRRVLLREAVQKRVNSGELTPEEHLNISTLITYTPNEWNVVLTDTSD